MKSELSLDQVVDGIYGKSYKRIRDISSSWYMFTPYQHTQSQEKAYFRLLEVPSSYRISQESYNKFSRQYRGLLHQVEIIYVERCFQVSYFLLKTSTNIISFRGLLELRSDCGQRVQNSLILRLLEFIAHLQGRNIHQEIQLDIDGIGLTQNSNFRVCNYSLYFVIDHSCRMRSSTLTTVESTKISERETTIHDLQQSARKVLSRVITLNKESNLTNQDLYIKTIENYNLNFANVVCQILTLKQFKKDRILELLNEQMQQQSEGVESLTTMTDSFIQSIDLKDDIEVIHGSFVNTTSEKTEVTSSVRRSKIRQTFSTMVQTLKSKPKLKKGVQFALIFIILALIVGGVALTLKLIHAPIACDQGEYLNPENTCLSCPFGCQRCINGQENQCISCKGSMYLVIESQGDKNGVCMSQCHGRYIGRNVCVKQHP